MDKKHSRPEGRSHNLITATLPVGVAFLPRMQRLQSLKLELRRIDVPKVDLGNEMKRWTLGTRLKWLADVEEKRQ